MTDECVTRNYDFGVLGSNGAVRGSRNSGLIADNTDAKGCTPESVVIGGANATAAR